jgi:hypothetical protein
VRTLKARKAPQEDVREAIAAYVALKDATVTTISLSPLEAAAARVKDLKARNAPQDEVKTAVAEYVSLKGVPVVKPLEVEVKSPEVDAAMEVVRVLKSRMAPQEEVRAAVDNYVALKYPSRAIAETNLEAKVGSAAVVSESPTAPQTPLDEAMAKVRSLKAAKASQADVSAAVAEYKRLKAGLDANVAISPVDAAIAKVRALKQANATQAEVSAAVAEYKSLVGADDVSRSGNLPQHLQEAREPNAEPTVHVHLPDAV